MHRQKIQKLVEEASYALEYYPKVMKFILREKCYYAICSDFLGPHDGMRAELFTLPKTQSGDDSVLHQEIKDQGVLSDLVVNLEHTSLCGQEFILAQIINKYAEVMHILFLEPFEFDENFRRSTYN